MRHRWEPRRLPTGPLVWLSQWTPVSVRDPDSKGKEVTWTFDLQTHICAQAQLCIQVHTHKHVHIPHTHILKKDIYTRQERVFTIPYTTQCISYLHTLRWYHIL